MSTAKFQAKPKSKKTAMRLSATSMAALLTACGGESGPPNISGNAKQGETLTANLANSTATNISHQWQSNGVNIAGATNSTHVLTQDDLGKTITATTSYTDGQGTAQSETYTATTPITIGSEFALSQLSSDNGVRIDAVAAGDRLGYSATSAGDVNGDGHDDLIMSAYYANANGNTESGSSYVLYSGGDLTDVDLSALPAAQGFRIDGAATGDRSGRTVSSAGDVNGDGYDDIIIGSGRADPNGNVESGSSYVIYGDDGLTNVDLAALPVAQGFTIDGANADDRSGDAVSSAGDINGDGYDDLIIGAPYASPNGDSSGSSYVVFGGPSLTNINLSSLDGSNGFKVDGLAEGDLTGISVSSAGDLNTDGYDDLVIGAYRADSVGNDAGSVYIIYGGAHFAATAVAASADDDVSVGDSNANTLNTGAGKDLLKGGLGADILTGGTDADHMWGGGNLDTFSFAVGDSQLTITGTTNQGQISGYDVIHDFKVATTNFLSETIDLSDGFSVVGNTTADGIDSSLEVGSEGVIQSHSLTDGVISFDNINAFTTAVDLSAQGGLAATVQYLQLQDLGNAGATVAFDYGADTFIFSQGDDLGTDDLDILIKLEATQVDNLLTTNAMGDFDLLIA